MSENSLHGGIDAGGTTFKCGLADASGNLINTHRVQVTTPEETLAAAAGWFASNARSGSLKTFGIASFGPIDVDSRSASYGTITGSAKPGWSGMNLRGHFADALGLPVTVDTDVNGALLAEMILGAALDCSSAAYVTVGTGIGAGLFANGGFLGRPSHPEFGHIALRRHPSDGDFKSVCPFHDDCLEGLASVRAIRARANAPEDLPADHPVWDIAADYLAQAARTLTLSFRPERIILGGGLMLAPHLISRIHKAFDQQMGGYLEHVPSSELITTPGLGDNAGLIGAILLGQQDAQ
ncbi:MAG TPA: ROK family protein [Henriciella marina]|uniref:ROK family protein n=1 Tax=Henriciella sp. TaxID=1968823 RepID=UPI0018343760|nr:ROK family protein [Henriciella sp.]HIG23329.1 ROK family protein [Henriciella sp.]HIK65639.1 ROK family protein [Henriciella marina]